MGILTRTLERPWEHAERLRRARFGLIEIVEGRLRAIHLRSWPKIISALEIELWGRRRHAQAPGDRCLVYYNQPWGSSRYLACKYVVSHRDCTLASIRRAAQVLDEVARLKHSDGLVCDVWNDRISERFLRRWGWEPLAASRWHRPYIKRFYGVYLPAAEHVLHAAPR